MILGESGGSSSLEVVFAKTNEADTEKASEKKTKKSKMRK